MRLASGEPPDSPKPPRPTPRSSSGEPPGSPEALRGSLELGEPPGSPRPLPPVRLADRPLHGPPPPVRFADERLRRWLLIRGRGEAPLDAHVRVEQIRGHSSSKRPSVQRGDEAILYAAVWQAVFGVVDVAGDPENDPERRRWSWTFP